MKRWGVVFRNFGHPRMIRRTFTFWGAQRVVRRLREDAPIGGKIAPQFVFVRPCSERRRVERPWPPEQERRRPEPVEPRVLVGS